jgi:hypothetical protein
MYRYVQVHTKYPVRVPLVTIPDVTAASVAPLPGFHRILSTWHGAVVVTVDGRHGTQQPLSLALPSPAPPSHDRHSTSANWELLSSVLTT